MTEKYLDIVFDGPPSHVAGRFVEVEDQDGKSTSEGCTWVERPDGLYALRIPAHADCEGNILCHHILPFLAREDALKDKLQRVQMQITPDYLLGRWVSNREYQDLINDIVAVLESRPDHNV